MVSRTVLTNCFLKPELGHHKWQVHWLAWQVYILYEEIFGAFRCNVEQNLCLNDKFMRKKIGNSVT